MRRSRWVVAASMVLALCTNLVKGQPTPRFDQLNEPGTQGFGSMMRVSPFDANTALNSGDQWGTEITNDGGVTWQPCYGMTNTSTGNNPDENDFTFLSSTTVWAGSAAGPFESTDGGHTWTIMRSGMPTVNPQFSVNSFTCPIEKVIQDPNTPATLYAVSGSHRQIYPVSAWGQVWKSTNSGASWGSAPIGTVVSGKSINDCCFQTGSSTVMFAATGSGLYRSSNSGVSWTQVSGTPSVGCYCVTADPTNANVVYAGFDTNGSGTGYGIYKTTTATTTDTWSAINSGISTSGPNDLDAAVYTIAVAPTNTSVIYLGFYSGATYYSSNGGSSWTKIVWAGTNSPVSPASGVPGNLAFEFLSVDPTTASTVWGTGSSNVWKSTNSGTSWQTLTNYATNSAYRGNGCSGLDGTGAVWNPKVPGQIWTPGLDSGKQLRSSDYLWSWLTGDTFSGSKGPYNGSYAVSIANDGTVYIGTGQFGNVNGVYTNEAIIKYNSTSPGWSYLSYPSGASGECMSIYTLPTNSSKIWAVYGTSFNYGTGRIYYSSNGGSSWTDITPSGASNVFNIAVDPLNTNYIYVGANNGVYQSNSGGASFQSTAMSGSQSDGQLNYVFPDPGTTSGLYQVIWKRSSTNIYHLSGGTWNPITYTGWMKGAFALAVDPNNASRIAVVTKTPSPTYDIDWSSGIFLSSNGGSTWTQYNNLKLNSAGGIAFNPDDSSQLVVPMDGGDIVCDWGTSTPNGGSPVSVPGTVQAASYDNGGNKIAYYTPSGSVSTASGDGGTVITSLAATDWIKYEINPSSSGVYSLDIRYSATDSNTVVHLEANGVNVTGPITLSSTSGYTDKVITGVVRLITGAQYLKLYVEKSGGASIHTIGIGTSGSGSLVGSTTGETAGFSLTVLTPNSGNDWAAYGAGGTSFSTFDDKITGGSQISHASEYGGSGGNWGAYSNTEFDVSWTDGTPTTSDNEGAIIWENASDPNGTTTWGIQFTAPASTVSHTLYIFWGGSQCSYELNAHLSDSSAPDYNTGSIEGPATGSTLKQTTVTYNAASAGQTLTLTLTKVSNVYSGGNQGGGPITTGSVNLTCAWLH